MPVPLDTDTKMIFKGSGCFQFPEAVVTSTAKENLRSTEHCSLQVIADLKPPCTTVTNFCSEGKPVL